MSFGRLRLTTQLTILVSATTLITLSVVVLILLARAQTIVEDAIVARNVQLLETTARQLAAAARHSDIVAAREVMAPIPQPGSIRRIALYSMTGIFLNQEIASDMPLGEEGGDEDLAREALISRQIVQRRAPNLITLVAPVQDGDRSVGAVAMELPTDDIQRQWMSLRETAALVGGLLVMVMALAAWGIARYTARPIEALIRAAVAFGRGDLLAPVEVRRGGELGTLAQQLRRMGYDLQQSHAQIEAQNHALEQRVAERTGDLERTLSELRESIGTREQLRATVRELSSPVMPVLDNILVMPLIGTIDSERASLLVGSLLAAIEKHRALYVIMDVTGVPIVDTQVARMLLNAASAAKLLGTQTILVGLRPELAQTIVGLGLDLSGLVTRTDLQSGVAYALELRRNAKHATSSLR